MLQWLRGALVCPLDHQRIEFLARSLTCPSGHVFPVIDGIPIPLPCVADGATVLDFISPVGSQEGPFYSDSKSEPPAGVVDPFVQDHLVSTNGNLYKHLVGRLTRYPIPDLPLPEGSGSWLLDMGCNWGRWSIAAARKGYNVVGIDPWPEAVMAAHRISRQLNLNINYIVADIRSLPFRSEYFSVVFSYGVLQHLPKEDVRQALEGVRRVLLPSGLCMVQMANKYGLRSLYQRFRKGGREDQDFDVRYWGPAEVIKTFRECIGPTTLSADGYFALNVQPADVDLLPLRFRSIVHSSETFRKASRSFGALKYVADSLYVSARRGTR